MWRGLAAALAAVWLVVAPARPVHAQPFCRPGEAPEFRLGFALLKEQLGPLMGEPAECEHLDRARGDTLQRTSTGLAYYRPATNTPAFTDGYRHWAWTADGLVAWEGAAISPPATGWRAPPLSPVQLLGALLVTPFDDRELPAGFSSAETLPPWLPRADLPGQPLGIVDVLVNGPDFVDGIGYAVYQAEADARAHFERAPVGAVPVAGFPHPALCFTALLPLEGEAHRMTGCATQVGHVEVLGTTIVRGQTGPGDNGNAIALMWAGVVHLEKVRAR
jgi:hypothetical protein